ncbi:HotDog domain-containing protein [Crepidotus variabilis]|uniref:HotDog domain-containing protein n=1 Tax=Crepidotus variabilis TaxID=179855 RepID=A0A9P6E4L1_9AGAR|nr:HotDog domain-containing protein [Crepidotus variabilis]
MSSRYHRSASNASAMLLSGEMQAHEPLPSARNSRQPSSKAWVDPASLPNYDHNSFIAGNAPDYVKQLNYNTFMCYGVGEPDSFGYKVGKAVEFVEVNINRKRDRNERLEATTVAEIEVTKHMLNGAGMLHGGCVAYLIDNCCSTPLVVLGLIQSVNGVGVTQSMNVHFHAPAPKGTTLRIISSSVSLGGRVMSARCEIIDKDSGRMVASAFMSKMQPVPKL